MNVAFDALMRGVRTAQPRAWSRPVTGASAAGAVFAPAADSHDIASGCELEDTERIIRHYERIRWYRRRVSHQIAAAA
jgi:hypothetical protein